MRRPPASFGVGWQPQPLLDAFQMLPSSPARGPPSFAWKAEPEGFFYSHLARKGEQQKCLSSPSSPSLQERAECRCGRLTARGEAGKPGALGLLLERSPGAAGELRTRTWIGIWTELGAVLAPDEELGAEMMLKVLTRAREHLTSCPSIPAAWGLGDVPGVLAELGSLFVAGAGTFGVGRRFLPERQRWRAGERRGKEGRERGRAR